MGRLGRAVCTRSAHALKEDPCVQVTSCCPGFPSISWSVEKLPLASLQGENPPWESQAEISQAILAEHVGFRLFTSFRALPGAQLTASLRGSSPSTCPEQILVHRESFLSKKCQWFLLPVPIERSSASGE